MPERPSLSPAFEKLRKICATCGKQLPCPLHDRALLEAILKPPEPEYPWDKMERTDIGNYGHNIDTIASLPDGTIFVGGAGGRILQLDPSKPEGQREHDLGNYGSNIYATTLLSDGTLIVGGWGGIIARYAIPPDVLRAYHDRKLQGPKIPLMPE